MGESQESITPPASIAGRDQLDELSLDLAVREVAENVLAWVNTPPLERADLLARVVRDTLAVSEEWCAAGCAAKGYDPASKEGAEELFSGVGTFVRLAQGLRRSMLDLSTKGRPLYPGPVGHASGDRLVVRVVPTNVYDRILYAGVTGEVWMAPGVDEAEVRATQAPTYRGATSDGGVSLVLGAGNVASLGPRDVLSKLFVDGHVVVLKANPVNDYLVPYWTRAMRAFIEGGFLRIVAGGAREGAYLSRHVLVSDVHVTGSDKTHDAIVFGVGDEGARRKVDNDPLITKPVSCELGNVSPVVIVPGQWSKREIAYQARHVATMMVNNAGFNCLTPRVIVTHAAWAQREEFFTALEKVLASLPTRLAYYPRALEHREAFVASHADVRQLGDARGEGVPWVLVRDVDPTHTTDVAFNVEAFCALTSETSLEASSNVDFIKKATDFCNDVLWGTLSMTLIVDPRTLKDPLVGPALEEAVGELRYGSIGVNLWHALSFAFGSTVWGAYPGHALNDIQSGRGFVGNSYLFAQPQKSVVRGPFVARPDPSWFATNERAPVVMRRLLAFEAKPSPMKLLGLLGAALARKRQGQ